MWSQNYLCADGESQNVSTDIVPFLGYLSAILITIICQQNGPDNICKPHIDHKKERIQPGKMQIHHRPAIICYPKIRNFVDFRWDSDRDFGDECVCVDALGIIVISFVDLVCIMTAQEHRTLALRQKSKILIFGG